jgi:integrase
MGTIYQRQVRVCTTCARRLDTTAARLACEVAGHPIVTQAQAIWWIRYRADGREVRESAHSPARADAEALLAQREQPDVAPDQAPVESVPLTFDQAAADLITEYRINGKRSLRTLRLRIAKHLTPAFGGQLMTAITPTQIRAYILTRQGAGASNASINRDLITVKRMFSLAMQAGHLTARPHVALLRERNIRTGFFEPAQLQAIQQHLPVHMRGIAAFAYITGWRTPSEILPLTWRQVDWTAGEVRLDPGTTKNGEGRVFPLTRALRQVLEAQRDLAADRGIQSPQVFCYLMGQKAGQRITLSAYIHRWWRARVLAGCPDRIPHDFRRTAVRNLVRAGVPERVAMQLSGHKTRAIFERYNITSPQDLCEAAARLDRYETARR